MTDSLTPITGHYSFSFSLGTKSSRVTKNKIINLSPALTFVLQLINKATPQKKLISNEGCN
jgi:hypothetical protein